MDLNWSADHSSPPAAVVLVSMSSTTSSTSSTASAHSKSSSPFLAFWLNNCAASNLALKLAASSAVRSLAANFSTYASPSEKSDTNQTKAFSALGMGLSTHWGCWATTWKEKVMVSFIQNYYQSNFSARGVILTHEVSDWFESFLLPHNKLNGLLLTISHELGVSDTSLFPLLVAPSEKLSPNLH